MKKNYSTPKIKHVILEPSDIVCESLTQGEGPGTRKAEAKRYNGIWEEE